MCISLVNNFSKRAKHLKSFSDSEFKWFVYILTRLLKYYFIIFDVQKLFTFLQAKNVQHFSTFHRWEVNDTVKSFIKDKTCFGNFINLPKNIEVPRDVLNYLLNLYENKSEADGGKHFLFDGEKIIAI